MLALIVATTNMTQKIAAAHSTIQFVSINPEDQIAITQGVDPYTPIISNDSAATSKAILANAMSDGFITSAGTVATEITNREEPSVLPSNDATTIQYTVQNGDTLSGLGMKFDVKIASLKYVNNIDNEDNIKPGQTLKIPPKGYEVSSAQIAKKEKDRLAKLAAASRNTVVRSSSSARATGSAKTVNAQAGSRANGYPYGWCTYYVATRRYVPSSWGNARNWLTSARRAGYSTGSEPAVGAIVVTGESGYGHVAYVESVNGDTITVAEMNYEGWGVTSRRTLSASAGVIRGFVY
jgi:surface antigen